MYQGIDVWVRFEIRFKKRRTHPPKLERDTVFEVIFINTLSSIEVLRMRKLLILFGLRALC